MAKIFRFKIIILAAICLIGAIFSISRYGYLNAGREPEIKDISVENDKIPVAFDGKKIIFLSDIHFGLGPNLLKKAVDKINEMNPDYLIIGGDLIDKDPKKIDGLMIELQKINPAIRTFVVLGNHDNVKRVKTPLLDKLKEDKNLSLINNDGLWLTQDGGRVRLGGVGAYSNDRQDLSRAMGDAETNDFRILVSHEPDYFEVLDKAKVDLVLSGHLHGGQATLFGLWHPLVPTRYFNKFMKDRVQENGTTMLISSGLGTTLAPIRIGSRPEMMLITLKAAGKR